MSRAPFGSAGIGVPADVVLREDRPNPPGLEDDLHPFGALLVHERVLPGPGLGFRIL